MNMSASEMQREDRWDYHTIPDSLNRLEFYHGIRFKRSLAYLLDLFFIGIVMLVVFFTGIFFSVITFGLLWTPFMVVLSVLPVLYHTLLIGGPNQSTWGMRLMGLKTYNWHGGAPSYIQALVVTVAFYASIAFTSFLILLVSIFNSRGRCLHDLLCGIVVVNDLPLLEDRVTYQT